MAKKMLTTLKGTLVQLEPIQQSHKTALFGAANHEAIWQYMPYKAMDDAFNPWFDHLMEQMEGRIQVTYVVRRISDQLVVGSTSYYDMHFDHQRLSLGYSWYIPSVWSTGVNLECKLLMLTQAFEAWQVNRVEIGADPRNERSVMAIKKLGASEEGVLRQHMMSHEGFLTDTIVFSILAKDWPHAKKIQQQRLACS